MIQVFMPSKPMNGKGQIQVALHLGMVSLTDGEGCPYTSGRLAIRVGWVMPYFSGGIGNPNQGPKNSLENKGSVIRAAAAEGFNPYVLGEGETGSTLVLLHRLGYKSKKSR